MRSWMRRRGRFWNEQNSKEKILGKILKLNHYPIKYPNKPKKYYRQCSSNLALMHPSFSSSPRNNRQHPRRVGTKRLNCGNLLLLGTRIVNDLSQCAISYNAREICQIRLKISETKLHIYMAYFYILLHQKCNSTQQHSS